MLKIYFESFDEHCNYMLWRSCVHMIEEETNVQIPVLPRPSPVSLCDHLLPLHTFIPGKDFLPGGHDQHLRAVYRLSY